MGDKWQPLTLAREPKPRLEYGYIIINEWGIWHSDVFETASAAQRYLTDYWPNGVPDGFNIVLGKKTVEVQMAPHPCVVRAALAEEKQDG